MEAGPATAAPAETALLQPAASIPVAVVMAAQAVRREQKALAVSEAPAEAVERVREQTALQARPATAETGVWARLATTRLVRANPAERAATAVPAARPPPAGPETVATAVLVDGASTHRRPAEMGPPGAQAVTAAPAAQRRRESPAMAVPAR
jgi:hypothetical protein